MEFKIKQKVIKLLQNNNNMKQKINRNDILSFFVIDYCYF